MGEAWDPQESLKIKNHRGGWSRGADASPWGISPLIVTPPGTRSHTQADGPWLCRISVNSEAGDLGPQPLTLCVPLDE